jgi:hypothetical protein
MSVMRKQETKSWSHVVAAAVFVALVGCGGEVSRESELEGADEAVRAFGPFPVLPLPLENLIPISDISSSMGNEKHYRFVVPPGQMHPKFTLSGGVGNADIYVKYNQKPSTSNYDCKSETLTNGESCVLSSPYPSGGTWYVMVRATQDYSGATLHGEYSLNDGISVEGLAGSTGNVKYFKISTQTQQNVVLNVVLSGGTGDADIYVKRGALPTLSDYDCRGYKPHSNEEFCELSSYSAGTYYIMVHGFYGYSNATLQAYSINHPG